MEEIPLTLAENSDYNPIEHVAAIRKQQIDDSNAYLGVDCMFKGLVEYMVSGHG